MSHWVSPRACSTFSFGYLLGGREWWTLENYILDYMVQEGLWPSTVTRNVEGETTNICLFTGKEWVGRYEEDVCTIIKQITGDVHISVSWSPC